MHVIQSRGFVYVVFILNHSQPLFSILIVKKCLTFYKMCTKAGVQFPPIFGQILNLFVASHLSTSATMVSPPRQGELTRADHAHCGPWIRDPYGRF